MTSWLEFFCSFCLCDIERMMNMNAEVKASRLVGLVDYQDQSVVSKTLIEKKTGTVTLFAFDQGQGLS